MSLPARRISRLYQYLFLALVLMLGGTGQPLVRAQEKIVVAWHPAFLMWENYASAEEIVAEFNASQDEIELVLATINSSTSHDYLDISSAVGGNVVVTRLEQRSAKDWPWLDLQPFIDSSGYDLSRYDPQVLDIYRYEGELHGLPIILAPQVIFYNRDLFDAAGLAYPPHHLGETYADGDAWDMAKLKEIGQRMTLDQQGRNALDPDFDPETIIQYGFAYQWFNNIEHLLAPFTA